MQCVLYDSFDGFAPLLGQIFNTIFVSCHMCPKNPEGTQAIVRSMIYEHEIWYISDTARDRTHNLFCHKCATIPLGHSDGQMFVILATSDHLP